LFHKQILTARKTHTFAANVNMAFAANVNKFRLKMTEYQPSGTIKLPWVVISFLFLLFIVSKTAPSSKQKVWNSQIPGFHKQERWQKKATLVCQPYKSYNDQLFTHHHAFMCSILYWQL